ncbi:MAG: hypothetical protein ACR2PK_19970 [Acidimicrobiales bacterium]
MHVTRVSASVEDNSTAIEILGLLDDPPDGLTVLIELPDGEERSTVLMVWDPPESHAKFVEERMMPNLENLQRLEGGPMPFEPLRLFVRG